MKEIILVDLCCKAGGCSMGYYQAAKELGLNIKIIGVDIQEQNNYPFEFIQEDAVSFLKNNHKDFTHIHASPPCQKYTQSTAQYRKKGKEYPDIYEGIKKIMYEIKKPGVIENVPASPIRPDIILKGTVFGLKVIRKRHFELVNWFMMQPLLEPHKGKVSEGDYVSVFGHASYCKSIKDKQYKYKEKTIRETWATAMGIDWYMKDVELSEAIPPAYTKYIGIEFFKNK